MFSTNEIRQMFLDFYQSKGHTILPSASLLPNEDERALLFTVAGMVPLKNVMLGLETRPYKRATSSQKCLRAGGKQNDLDNVGYTLRHHTFFEMLGNFSFGDYFKAEAIEFSWELLTKVFGLPREKLTVTVHNSDDESAKLWTKIAGIPDSEIIRLGKDNFWAMGDTGPCGPSTEIFFDYGNSVLGGKPGTAEEDGDRYVEVYNNVFMQNVRTTIGGELQELSQKNIDTGMGLERIASVLQGKHSNYDIDIFANLKKFTSDIFEVKITDENRIAFNVCTDHIRAATFAIADGIIPSNEGRGYVIRKIIRRAMRYINSMGINDICFYKLADLVEKEMGSYYKDLTTHISFIKSTIQTEEKLFMEAMQKGLSILNDAKKDLPKNGFLNGEMAFKLYDTYGFPLDMTQDILRREHMTVDVDGFNAEMHHQKEMSKGAGKKSSSLDSEKIDLELPKINDEILQSIKKDFGETSFIGYEKNECECNVIAVIKDEKKTSNKIVGLITDTTPFYAESGGQVADTGVFEIDNKIIASVIDVKKFDGVFVHYIKLINDSNIEKGMQICGKIDVKRRYDIAKNHSCAHLLQSALIDILGDHIKQKGSFTCDEYSRFDFANPRGLTPSELLKVEETVNKFISEKLPISKFVMPIEEARATGAIAPFDEKYGDVVRIIKMGKVSTEFCGGTHLDNTSEISNFIIEKEESIAAGIRRITSITGRKAMEKLQSTRSKDVVEYRKILADQESQKISEMNAKKQFEKEIELQRQNVYLQSITSSCKNEKINDITMLYVILSDISHKPCKVAFERMKTEFNNNKIFAIFITELDGKTSLSIGITDDLKSSINLSENIKKFSEILGGSGGGGTVTFASSGGTDFSKSSEVINQSKKLLKSL